MEKEFQSLLCDELEKSMVGISEILSQKMDVAFSANEKQMSFCHAIWQLLQSLKAIERAPTKKYDFWSLYQPLSTMIKILEEKMEKIRKGGRDEVSHNVEIYDFIHKISMTLHGTLRTDVQFFQIRDFNVIVHYAPAKLRAFYALWALKLSDFYNNFNSYKNQYSFIFCPGMYRGTCVKPLYEGYKENSRLMLIMVPERHLYTPKRLSIVLAHEVSHFVGYQVRNRETRHRVWLKSCARVLLLEMNHMIYQGTPQNWKISVEQAVNGLPFYEKLTEQLIEEDKMLQDENKDLWPHMFHSRNSFLLIKKGFREIAQKYIEKFVSDHCGQLQIDLKKMKGLDHLHVDEKVSFVTELKRALKGVDAELLALYTTYQSELLPILLKIFRYISTEAYADLIAILTLDLTPKDYHLSFCEGELNINIEENGVQEGLLLSVRAGIVIYAVSHVVKERGDWFAGTQFYDDWSKDVPRELSVKSPQHSALQWLSLNIYSYTTGLRDCNHKIGAYKSIYNGGRANKEGFIKTDLDFFNDQTVWDLMLSYMKKCAEDYVDILYEKPTLQDTRKMIVNTYRNVVDSSVTEMVQEIEDFLEHYEEEIEENIGK